MELKDLLTDSFFIDFYDFENDENLIQVKQELNYLIYTDMRFFNYFNQTVEHFQNECNININNEDMEYYKLPIYILEKPIKTKEEIVLINERKKQIYNLKLKMQLKDEYRKLQIKNIEVKIIYTSCIFGGNMNKNVLKNQCIEYLQNNRLERLENKSFVWYMEKICNIRFENYLIHYFLKNKKNDF